MQEPPAVKIAHYIQLSIKSKDSGVTIYILSITCYHSQEMAEEKNAPILAYSA